jgi:hypothetical protein
LNPSSVIVLSFVVLPLTYALCLAVGLWAEMRGRATLGSRLFLVVAIVGLSLLHQTLHRRDPAHLLQVAPPAMMGVCLLTAGFFGQAWFHAAAFRFRLLRAAAVSYLVSAVIAGLGLVQWGSQDLARFSVWPAQRFAGLADPLGDDHPHPAAAALREVQRRTRPDQSILVFSMDSQYYALVHRRLSGALYAYWPGVFATPPWRERNLAALERDLPALVVVRADFLDPAPVPDLVQQARESHAAVQALIRQRYSRVVYRGGGLLLLARGE